MLYSYYIANRTYEFDLQEEYANYSNYKVYVLNCKHYAKIYNVYKFRHAM